MCTDQILTAEWLTVCFSIYMVCVRSAETCPPQFCPLNGCWRICSHNFKFGLTELLSINTNTNLEMYHQLCRTNRKKTNWWCKAHRTTEAADKMWHFNIKISIRSSPTKSNSCATCCIHSLSLPVKSEISWLQRSLWGVSRWGLLARGLYGQTNGCYWTQQQKLNVRPTAYRTVIHSQTHQGAHTFRAILLWNQGLGPHYDCKIVIRFERTCRLVLGIAGKLLMLQKKRRKVLFSGQTWGQQCGLCSMFPYWRRCILLWHMKASSCLLIRSAVAASLPSARSCTNINRNT